MSSHRRRRSPLRPERVAPNRQPERTCVGCRRQAPRNELLRMIRRSDGEISIDPTGGAPGRGAYVHRNESCIRKAVRTGLMAKALRTTKEAGRAARLISEAMEMRSDR